MEGKKSHILSTGARGDKEKNHSAEESSCGRKKFVKESVNITSKMATTLP